MSLLPYWVLYRFSDFSYFLVYYVFGYRRKVVRDNLVTCFPERPDREILRIERKFYRHLCDLMIESIKNFTISEKTAKKRMKALNPEICEPYLKEKRSIIFCGGHFNNWELWAVSFPIVSGFPMAGIYKKINDPFLNDVMLKTRGKFGLKLVETKEITPEFFRRNRPIATVFAFDQSPQKSARAYWVKFLGRDTACFYGPEKYAKSQDLAVFFGHIKKVKRGYYETWYEPMFDKPRETEYGEIITALNAKLEEDILEKPEFWLWSHRRWKHKKQTEQ